MADKDNKSNKHSLIMYLLSVVIIFAILEIISSVFMFFASMRMAKVGMPLNISRDRVCVRNYEAYSADRNISADGWRMWPGKIKQFDRDYKGKIRVFMFGGSTMLSMGTNDNETIPYYLEKELEKKYKVILYNLGVGGYNNTLEAHILIDLLRKGEIPDVVVFYDGVNEIEGKEDLYAPYIETDPYYTDFKAAFDMLNKRDFWNELSCVRLGRLTKDKVNYMINRVKNSQRVRKQIGGDFEKNWKEEREKSLEAWGQEHAKVVKGNVRLLKQLADAYNFKLILFLQPHKILSLYKREKDIEKYPRDYVYSVINRELLEEKDSKWIDLTDVLEGVDPALIYLDPQHINAKGNLIVAGQMAKYLEPVLERMK